VKKNKSNVARWQQICKNILEIEYSSGQLVSNAQSSDFQILLNSPPRKMRADSFVAGKKILTPFRDLGVFFLGHNRHLVNATVSLLFSFSK